MLHTGPDRLNNFTRDVPKSVKWQIEQNGKNLACINTAMDTGGSGIKFQLPSQ